MNISFEIDNVTKKPLAVYVQIMDGVVHETVEVEENACYVDEDEHGNLLGVEFLVPGEFVMLRERVTNKYTSPVLKAALETAGKQLLAA